MELTQREQFVIKIYSMMDNKTQMKKEGKETPTVKELLQFMDMLRLTQYPKISFDTMLRMIKDFEAIGDQQIETSEFIIKQLKSKRHGKKRL